MRETLEITLQTLNKIVDLKQTLAGGAPLSRSASTEELPKFTHKRVCVNQNCYIFFGEQCSPNTFSRSSRWSSKGFGSGHPSKDRSA